MKELRKRDGGERGNLTVRKNQIDAIPNRRNRAIEIVRVFASFPNRIRG